MIDVANVLRLAGDGYGAHDIRKFTRVPVAEIRKVCQDAGVELKSGNPRGEAETRYQAKLAEKASWRPEPKPPKEKENPLKIASLWLGKHLVEKPSGFWLDGVPVNLIEIMRAANRVLKAEGAEQIGYSTSWLV